LFSYFRSALSIFYLFRFVILNSLFVESVKIFHLRSTLLLLRYGGDIAFVVVSCFWQLPVATCIFFCIFFVSCVLPLAAIIFSQPAASSYLLFVSSLIFSFCHLLIFCCFPLYVAFFSFFSMLLICCLCFGQMILFDFPFTLSLFIKIGTHCVCVMWPCLHSLSPFIAVCPRLSYILIAFGVVLYYPSAFDLLDFLTGLWHLPFG